MTTKTVVFTLLLFIAALFRADGQQPALFGANVISTQDDEFGCTFSPDGKTCFFTKRTAATITSSTYVICYSRWVNGQWSEPDIAPFSGKYKDFNPFFSPDGSSLFFISNRPIAGNKSPGLNIWMVRKQEKGWTEPEDPGVPINTPGLKLSCAVTADGSIYFVNLDAGTGRQGLFRSKLSAGRYGIPEMTGDSVVSFQDAADIFVSPDEKYLLFSSRSRPDALVAGHGASASYPRSDLYISFNKNGHWTTPKNVGVPINSTAEETNPCVSPDGQTLFFTSERNFITIPMKERLTYDGLEMCLHSPANGLGDIYQIPISALPGMAGSPGQQTTVPLYDSTLLAASLPPTDSALSAGNLSTADASGHGPSPPNYHVRDSLALPRLFGEGVITTPDDEFGGTLTPDGLTCYFSKSVLKFYIDVICFSRFRDGRWQTPEVAPFSGVYRDFDPVLSPDGTKMLFTSSRPVEGKEEAGYDIWMVEKTPTGWGEPIHLDTTINSPYNEHFASMAANGTIYFSSDRPGALGGEGDADIYRSRLVNGHYMPAEHLDSVSSTAYELDCLVSPDESLIFTGCYGRQGGYGNYDIYYSRQVNGVWSVSKNLGPKVNSRFRDYSPRLSPDGKYFFFTSERDFSTRQESIKDYPTLEKNLHGILNGSGNIYWVELKSLDLR